ncbi:SMI1/KNR4 family protein [Fulvivirga sp. 29W222]|uniref:SMI1/KNR4 family protein n=1 Tax=Fulvivirga marina TaxID=2494733 RepID=A0A937FVD2_9BACT|nr:SMI1/KNR4 family protein [Fulvivirga marina]MBL6445035.1 SMI1/KNR4 family protein [Fulvivirga marina]
MNIEKNPSLNKADIEKFTSGINFKLPSGYLEFMQASNGADISFDNAYLLLWPLTDLIQLNQDYGAEEFAPGFFLIGSDGGEMAYAISKETSHIYTMPFIGMTDEDVTLVSSDFNGLLLELEK